jgi:hypothetical protein
MTVWVQTIPGCTTRDFGGGNTCSAVCLSGLDLINVEVNAACAGASVSSDTLLGAFLQGQGVSILCPKAKTGPTTSTESTSQTQPSTSSQKNTQTIRTSITAAQTTTQSVQTSQTQASPQPTISATSISVTSTSVSSTTSTSLQSTLQISIGTTTDPFETTNPQQNRGSKTSAAASSSTDTEAKGFGGVGNAFNILGNDSARPKRLSQQILAVSLAVAILIGGAIW